MEEKNHRQKLHIKFKQITDLLTKRAIRLDIDEEISDDKIVVFNDFITYEGFEYEVLETILPQLLNELKDFEFYEVDNFKTIDVKKHMADRILNFVSDPFDDLIFKDQLVSLSKEHAQIVANFVQKQDNLKVIIANTLVSGINNDTSKTKKYARIVWNGTQTEIAELFEVLTLRKWIGKTLNKSQFVTTLCEMFLIEKEHTAHQNILDYYYRNKYLSDNHFADIKPAPQTKIKH